MRVEGSHPPGTWWRRRSLKLRLAVSFALIAGVLLLGLLPFVYHFIERRLGLDLDHELGIDSILIEAHLESDEAGGVRWKKDSPSTLDSGGYAESWFDVWSGEKALMSHSPSGKKRISTPPRRITGDGGLYNLSFDGPREARVLQKPARISGREVVLRVFRDRSNLQETLRQVLWVLALGAPLALVLAATGGYLMAGRTLRPIVEMTEQARKITSESLGQRLPNPNPHDELGQLASVFNQTLERLERSFESLRRFTADASHELRTPLTALRSVGEIALRESGDTEALRETIGSMLEEGQRLHDLTDSLLMLARVESGRIPFQLESISIDELVASVAESLEVLASEKGQKIDVDADSGMKTRADRVFLRQATMNLLHNAIRHSPPGSRLGASAFSNGISAVIEISDEGPGIQPEHHEKVFERFYRIDKARSRSDGGTGLGLALAKLFVEQCGGSLSLSSGPGEGCRFSIHLPLAVPSPDDFTPDS
jgi:heavy metal sensor kinase